MIFTSIEILFHSITVTTDTTTATSTPDRQSNTHTYKQQHTHHTIDEQYPQPCYSVASLAECLSKISRAYGSLDAGRVWGSGGWRWALAPSPAYLSEPLLIVNGVQFAMFAVCFSPQAACAWVRHVHILPFTHTLSQTNSRISSDTHTDSHTLSH